MKILIVIRLEFRVQSFNSFNIIKTESIQTKIENLLIIILLFNFCSYYSSKININIINVIKHLEIFRN